MAAHCPLCERSIQSSEEFCSLHRVAQANLESAYESWRNAHSGQLSRSEYIARLEKLPETGNAVKTLIKYRREKRNDA